MNEILGFDEETGKKILSDNSELSEESAVLVLSTLRKKIDNIKKMKISNEANYSLFCSICILPIQKGDIAYCLDCCDSVCHISCLSQIAKLKESHSFNKCPNCNKEFSKEMIEKFQKMQEVVKYAITTF